MKARRLLPAGILLLAFALALAGCFGRGGGGGGGARVKTYGGVMGVGDYIAIDVGGYGGAHGHLP